MKYLLAASIVGVAHAADWWPNWGATTCTDATPDPWQTDFFSDLDSCCKQRFSWAYETCNPAATTVATAAGGGNVWWPDWEDNTGCKNTTQPDYTPSYTTRETCCAQHFEWDYVDCMGIDDKEGKWWPDWGANLCRNTTAGRPEWMSATLYDDMDSCCEQHFGWSMDTCDPNAAQTLATTAGGGILEWFPDWEDDNTCKKHNVSTSDTNAPPYMIQNPYNWMFSDQDACCKKHFFWDYNDCMGIIMGGINATGCQWYPNWHGSPSTDVCLNDCMQEDYMTNNPNTWMYGNQEDCCIRYYKYNMDVCMGNGTSTTSAAPATYTGNEKWYVIWSDFTCRQDCATSLNSTNCGGELGQYDNPPKFDTAAECCATMSWRETDLCMP